MKRARRASLKPYYRQSPIASLDALASTLGVRAPLLSQLSNRVEDSYTQFDIQTKNKERTVYEAKHELKKIQKRINSQLFEKVEYPFYLQGGIKDQESKRDYVENAKIHASSNSLIALDIVDFYNNITESQVLAVYKQLFKFPNDVADVLTKLTTLHGRVPQGAATSSYIANLIFFNSEHSVVSKLTAKGFNYTRLLDDITLSSQKNLKPIEKSKAIKAVVGLLKKYDFDIKEEKTKILHNISHSIPYDVTGLWVGHAKPKLRKSERHYIRQMVFVCEKSYTADPATENYHDLWNKTSGLVAKMQRLEHIQAPGLRKRLSNILPIYSNETATQVVADAEKLLRRTPTYHKIGFIKKVNATVYRLGILGRTEKQRARLLKKAIKARFKDMPLKDKYWL